MDRFHPFANPLVWRKSQWLAGGVEWSTVNVMGVLHGDVFSLCSRAVVTRRRQVIGVLHEPFWSTGRFDIAFEERPPNYSLSLKITSKPV